MNKHLLVTISLTAAAGLGMGLKDTPDPVDYFGRKRRWGEPKGRMGTKYPPPKRITQRFRKSRTVNGRGRRYYTTWLRSSV